MPQDYDAAVRTVHHLRRTPAPEPSSRDRRCGADIGEPSLRIERVACRMPSVTGRMPLGMMLPRSIARGVRRRGLAAKRPGVADGHPDWADLHLALARMRTVMSLGGQDVGLNQRIQRSRRRDAGAELIRRQRRGRGRFPLAQSFQLAVAGMQPIDPLPEGIKILKSKLQDIKNGGGELTDLEGRRIACSIGSGSSATYIVHAPTFKLWFGGPSQAEAVLGWLHSEKLLRPAEAVLSPKRHRPLGTLVVCRPRLGSVAERDQGVRRRVGPPDLCSHRACVSSRNGTNRQRCSLSPPPSGLETNRIFRRQDPEQGVNATQTLVDVGIGTANIPSMPGGAYRRIAIVDTALQPFEIGAARRLACLALREERLPEQRRRVVQFVDREIVEDEPFAALWWRTEQNDAPDHVRIFGANLLCDRAAKRKTDNVELRQTDRATECDACPSPPPPHGRSVRDPKIPIGPAQQNRASSFPRFPPYEAFGRRPRAQSQRACKGPPSETLV